MVDTANAVGSNRAVGRVYIVVNYLQAVGRHSDGGQCWSFFPFPILYSHSWVLIPFKHISPHMSRPSGSLYSDAPTFLYGGSTEVASLLLSSGQNSAQWTNTYGQISPDPASSSNRPLLTRRLSHGVWLFSVNICVKVDKRGCVVG